jgi:hypothetical protein
MPQYMKERRRLLKETYWDKGRFPDRRAFERAVFRCESLRKRVIKNPSLGSRLIDWDFEYQYRLHVAHGQQRQ